MKLWTIKEVTEISGFSERTVRRAVGNGELQSRKIGGARRIHHDWLVAWLGCDPLQAASPTGDPAQPQATPSAKEPKR